MFNKMKRFLALTLTVLMLINALPVSALGEMASEWVSISYSYDDDSEGGSLSGRTITLPVYFYDNVRGGLAQKKTSIEIDSDGVSLSSSVNILSVLEELGGEYDSAKLADDDDNLASGTSVSYLRLGGSRNSGYYLTNSRYGNNSTRLDYEGRNLYVYYNPAHPAVVLPETLEISTGESRVITAELVHTSLSEATVTWASSSSDVEVTPDSADPTKATITGANTAQDVIVTVSAAVTGFDTASASMTVDVVQGVTDVAIYQSGVDAEGKTFNLETGGKQITFTAAVLPDDASDKTLTWTSSNPAVASVSNGIVTSGNVGGSATISAVASNGVKASVVVHTHPFSLEVEPAVVNIVEDEEFFIYPLISSITDDWTLTVTPADSTVVLATWNKAAGEAVLTAADLPEGAESASTTVNFTLTHTVDGVTESKSQSITVNVSPKAETEYYTVSLFDMSGVLFASTSVEEGGSFTLPTAESMAVEGYTFNGFKDLEDASKIYSGTIENIQENMILMADYTIIQHTVTFVVHEGDSANPGTWSVKVDHGDVVARPEDPVPATYDGYIATKFIDWHDHHDHTLRNSYDFWTPVTGDITLCAHFEEATFDVLLVTFAGTYQTYTYSAKDHTASVSLPSRSDLEDIPVTMPESADIEATHLGGYYTDKDEDATERKWSYFRFWQIAGTSDSLSVSSLDFEDLMEYAYNESTGEWGDVIINAVYEPNTNGGSTREYQSLNVTVPVRVVTEDGYVLGMGEVYAKATPEFGKGQGSSTTNGYNTTKVTNTTAKFGTVDLNGLEVTVTDSEGTTATYTIISGEDGNLLTDVELVWLCQMDEHVYGAMGSLASTHYCAGGCWNVLGIATVVVRLHSDDVRLRVNYYNLPEKDSAKEDAVLMKSLFFGDDDGKLEAGDVLTYLDYVEGIGQTYSYKTHDWIVGSEGTVAQNGNSYVLNIYYTHWPHTVTVNYVYENGETAAESKTSTLHKNTYYFITSPEIAGYVADTEIVRGKMPGHDLEYTVTYYALGYLQITKKVVDSAFDPDNTTFSFLVSNASRSEASTASVKEFTQNSDGSWSGSTLVELRAGRYGVQELNIPEKYNVSYSAEIVAVAPTNTAGNPAQVTVTNTAKEPKVEIAKSVTSQPKDGKAYTLGEEITYKLIISNTGAAAAANVKVVDELTGLNETIASLAAGESAELTTSYTVKEADILAGSVANVATADGDDSNKVEVETEDSKPALSVTKTASKTSSAKAGDVITYAIVVKNSGNVTVSDIAVTDSLTGDSWSIASLEPGKSQAFTAEYTVTENDILSGEIKNIATAAGKDPENNPVEGKDDEIVETVPADPALQVVKTVTSTPKNSKFYVEGETVVYLITVTNTGNVPLTDIAVTDALTKDSWTIASLAVGAEKSFAVDYIVTAADVAAGKVVNVAAAGNDDTTDEGEEEVPTGENPRPELSVEKVARNTRTVDLKGTIAYQITVTNTGNVNITDIVVTDSLTGDRWLIDSLAPGEYDIFTTTYTVTEADIAAGSIVNTAEAEGKAPDGKEVKDDDTETVIPAAPNKAWITEKSVVGDTRKYKLGETITYTIVVTNTGNQELTNLVVIDAKIGLNDTIASLAVGASETFTGSYVVTQADIAEGSVRNTAYVNDVPSNTVEVSTDDPASTWTIVKSVVDKKDEYDLGDIVTYEIVVTNTGNQDLKDLVVKDEKVGLNQTIDLPVGAQRDFTRTYTVTEADITAGEVRNIAYAGKQPSNEVVVKTEEKVESWTIAKSETSNPGSDGKYGLGDTVSYSIVVTNTGNQPLTGIRVTDALIKLDDIVDLAVGASETLIGSHIVTEADIAMGEISNIAFANEQPSNEVVVETEEKVESWTVTKRATSTPENNGKYALGEEITYEIVVTNTGNQPIKNLNVTDAKVGLDTTIDHLVVGSAEIFTATYTVTEGDISNGKVENTAYAGDVPSNTVIVPTEDHNPALYVSKTVVNEQPYYKLGETIEYQIVVKNTGNVTQYNVPVKDALIDLDTTIETLAIGEEKTFTGSYTVQEADVLRTYVKNVVTAGDAEDEYTVDTEEPTPSWTVEKTVTGKQGKYKLGEVIHYQIVVRNTGNVRLTGIRVVDELIGLDDTINLAIGAAEVFTGSYIVAQEDILRGYVYNKATAGSGDKIETDEHEQETEDLTPGLSVTKTVNGKQNGYKLGETVHYTITVRNSGNVRISGITVTDDLTGDTWTLDHLLPGAAEVYNTSYVITETDVIAGKVLNNAAAAGEDPTGTEVSDKDSAEVSTEEINSDLTVDKETLYTVGHNIYYQITVSNTGNLTIDDIAVTDALTGDAWTISSLMPGGFKVFQAMYTVREQDIIAGSVTNVAKASGTDTAGNKVEDQDSVVDPTEASNPKLTVEKKVVGENRSYKLGETIRYQITVRNTGNLTLRNVQVVDGLVGLNDTIDHLAPGATETFTASYVVTEADILSGSVLNVATVKGETDDPGKPTVEDKDEIETDVDDANSDIHVVKRVTSTPADGRAYQLGEKITYSIQVHNGGNLTLTDVTVKDDLTGEEWHIDTLTHGHTQAFTTSYIVTEADIIAGSVLNVATAKATTSDPSNPTIEDADEVETDVEDADPALIVEKTITSTPKDGVSYDIGESVSFRIVVKNTGNVTITDIVVNDYKTFDTWRIASLAPGEEKVFTADGYVVDEDGFLEKLINVAIAKGKDPTGEDVEGSDTTEDPVKPARAEIQVEKTITSTPADPRGYAVGEEITYEIVVTNTGNLRLKHVSVEDELTGDEWYFEAMMRYSSRTVTASYIVTEADIIAGSVLNVVTAQGETNYPEFPLVEDDDAVGAETEPSDPSIRVTKTVTSIPADGVAYKLGEEIRYRIVAANTGNITVKNITVEDDLTGESWEIVSLAPGETMAFATSYNVTEADMIAGSVVNVATAQGKTNDPDEPTVSDKDDAEADVEDSDPEVKVTKTVTSTPANGEFYRFGEKISYSIVVHNTGNITVKNITVEDELTGESWEIASLAPGKAEAFTTGYNVTEADMIAGSVINVAAAEGKTDDPKEPEVEEEDEVEAEVEDSDPEIKVTKIVTSTPAEGEFYKLGEIIQYSVTVENTGNITVKNITVEDELTGDSWQIVSLAPAAAETFTASYTVTEADMIVGSVLNVATVKGATDDPDEPTVEDKDEVEADVEDSDPAVEVVKTVVNSKNSYIKGETVRYEITVKNTGNITAYGIIVADELTGDEWTIESLAPGASETFTAKHTVTEADVRRGKVVNVATATGTTLDPDEPTVEDDDKVVVETEEVVVKQAGLGRVVMNVGDCFE